MITRSTFGSNATVAIFLAIVHLGLSTCLAQGFGDEKETTLREVDGGYFMIDCPMSLLVDKLANNAGYQFFHNPALNDDQYLITGQLNEGNPLSQIETLAFQFGCTVFYKEKTIYLLTHD